MHECVHGSAVCILHSRLADLIVTHIFTLIIWCNGDGKESLYYIYIFFFNLFIFFSEKHQSAVPASIICPTSVSGYPSVNSC